MASLYKVKALYDFEAKEEDDLALTGGQIIDVTEEVDDNWLEGRYTDDSGASNSGIFPRDFVEKHEPEVPTRPARPARAKPDAAPVPTPTQEVADAKEVADDEQKAPPIPAASKPEVPPVELPKPSSMAEEQPRPPSAKDEPPPPPKPANVEPAAPAAPAAKKPPPVATKSNAFRDRIAAFNQAAAAPLAPVIPGGPKPQSNTFIRKPFVAPPPMANSYVPPPRHEPVHRPYLREEDPEIKKRREEDRAAAEAAGLTGGGPTEKQEEDDDDAPKPMTLKERMALLQKQQMEQAQRRADNGPKKEKKPPAPPKKPSDSSADVQPGDGETLEHGRAADAAGRQSLDASRDAPPVPPVQRRPTEPLSPGPAAPDSELVSDGNDADQSAAGETTEDDTGTIGPDDSDDKYAPPPPPRAAAVPMQEEDEGNEADHTEGAEEEESEDEEERRRRELRERMAKMSGGMGMAGLFGPLGGMPIPGAGPPKKRKEKQATEDTSSPPLQPQQRVPMIPMIPPQRVQSPDSINAQQHEQDDSARTLHEDGNEPLSPSQRSTAEERGAPPPVPRGK
jgi:hypothetical protein